MSTMGSSRTRPSATRSFACCARFCRPDPSIRIRPVGSPTHRLRGPDRCNHTRRGKVVSTACHGCIGALRRLRVGPCAGARADHRPEPADDGAAKSRRERQGVAGSRRTRARGAPGRRKTPMSRVRDTRIVGYEPLLSPAALVDELGLGEAEAQTVERTRAEVRAVLNGTDGRLLVVTGPCSVHDPKAALDYAVRLRELRDRYASDLLIVMRVYFEKPRTVTGWKGLINDPGTPQYIADAVTWGAIGARTTESQVHRQLASGLSMPVGFKNGTDGDVQVAVDACRASAASHTFFGVTPQGAAAVVTTGGNSETHVILRGGRSGPNYSASHVAKALDLIEAVGLPRRVMVDASHGNSGKDYTRQPAVAQSLAEQITGGEQGVVGVMLESFLVAGRQEPGDPAALTYGQSVTDA